MAYRVISWERAVSGFLAPLKLDRIRNQILVFAVLAASVPALTISWMSYSENRRALTAKIAEGLKGASQQAARETDLWIKEHVYDLKVFAASYEVSENLDRSRHPSGRPSGARVDNYLGSVKTRFSDYGELQVLGPDLQVVGSSSSHPGRLSMPENWLSELKVGNPIIGQPQWNAKLGQSEMNLAVGVVGSDGRVLGALAGRLKLEGLNNVLRGLRPEGAGAVYLMTEDGQPITRPEGQTGLQPPPGVPERAVRALFESKTPVVEYRNHDGLEMLGTVQRTARAPWAAVAELPELQAYGQIVRLRNLALLTVGGLAVGLGCIAYLMGLIMVRRLDRLTGGARQVAGGDLSVDLPIQGGGEVAYLTEVFNEMVARLRAGRQALDAANEALRQQNQELERLSITDGLTGLYNRRHLMQTLTKETSRARRQDHSFAVLMLDVDHFKRLNDVFGHQTGDAVLSRVAGTLQAAIREVDYAARYGGEEFLIVLPETGEERAHEVAERIRSRVEETITAGAESRSVTVSIGVATFPRDGESPESLIASADRALYDAKQKGRNRVVLSREASGGEAA